MQRMGNKKTIRGREQAKKCCVFHQQELDQTQLGYVKSEKRDVIYWSYSSNTVLSFSDSRILNLYNPSKMSSGGIFVKDNKIPSHFESNS